MQNLIIHVVVTQITRTNKIQGQFILPGTKTYSLLFDGQKIGEFFSEMVPLLQYYLKIYSVIAVFFKELFVYWRALKYALVSINNKFLAQAMEEEYFI